MQKFDCVIVGFGPVGALLSLFLSRLQLKVAIIDKNVDIYPLPRAIHFDQEVMRIFQMIGLNEKVSSKQWIGVLLGFVGAALVLGLDVGSGIPLLGLIATIVALISITISTIWQKKLSNNLPLSVNNFYQAIGGCVFHFFIIIFFAEPYIDFTKTFIIAMSHQIFLVSFGAFTILMYLIRNNSASKTVSIFFLIPATSAFMAWLFLNESLTNLDLLGFLITTVGVYIATRD